jgi:cation transport ATPase
MSARTRTLAWIWLGLAAAALVCAGWAWEDMGHGGGDISGAVAAMALAFVLVVFWAVPLTVGCVALLRGRRYGWWVLMIVAFLGCLVFGSATFGSLLSLLRGQVLRSLPAPAMLAFSIVTVRWLLRDRPENWA